MVSFPVALAVLAQRGNPSDIADFAQMMGRLGSGARGSGEVDARLDRMFANDPRGRQIADRLFRRFSARPDVRRLNLRVGSVPGGAGARAASRFAPGVALGAGKFGTIGSGKIGAAGLGASLGLGQIRLTGYRVTEQKYAGFHPLLVSLTVSFPEGGGDPVVTSAKAPTTTLLGDVQPGEALPIGMPALGEAKGDTLVVTAVLNNAYLYMMANQYGWSQAKAAPDEFVAELTTLAKASAGLVASLDTKDRATTLQKAMQMNVDMLKIQKPGGDDVINATYGFLPLTAAKLAAGAAAQTAGGVPYDAACPIVSSDGTFAADALFAYRPTTGADLSANLRGLTIAFYAINADGWTGTMYVPEVSIDGKTWTSPTGFLDPMRPKPKNDPPADQSSGSSGGSWLPGFSWPKPVDVGGLLDDIFGSSGMGTITADLESKMPIDELRSTRRSQGVNGTKTKILVRVRNCDEKGVPIFDCSVDPKVGKTLTLTYNPNTDRLEGISGAKKGSIVAIQGKGGNAVKMLLSVRRVE